MAYDPNWRQKALDAGKDQNSAEFASMRAQESSGGSSGSSGSGSTSYNTTDLNKAIDEAIKRQQAAIKPQVDSLTASAPEITAKYNATRTDLQAQRAPLTERYNTLIASIKGQGTEAVNNQTKITSNELGKRGLLGSSTLAQQEIQNAVSPLDLKYKTLETTANQDQTDALSGIDRSLTGLTTAETADQRALQNAIASLMAGAAGQGISTGSSVYGTSVTAAQQQALLAQQQQNAADQAAREQKQQEIVNELARAKLANETAQTNYDVNKPYPASSSSGGGSYLDTLLAQIQGGSAIASPGRYTLAPGAVSSKPGLSSFYTN